jgi:hypothetical protein
VKRKVAIGLAAAVIATGGLTLSASADPPTGGYKHSYHGRHRIIDYKLPPHGPRLAHRGGIIDYKLPPHGPHLAHRGGIIDYKLPPRHGPYGRGPIPHYRGGRITDTWP